MSQSRHLLRDVAATQIPAGTPATLTKGTEVWVTQTLGGNITVRCDLGLFRIDAVDAGAVGEEFAAGAAPEPAAPTGAFSEQRVWDALKTCFDPEIPVNIVDLGLVYDLAVEKTPAGGHHVDVKMTLTAPGCGMGPVIANDAKNKILALPGVESANVVIVWDPVWTPQMISPDGRKVLGLE